jgi:hypothetical protein
VRVGAIIQLATAKTVPRIPYAVCVPKPNDAHARLRKTSYAKFRAWRPVTPRAQTHVKVP